MTFNSTKGKLSPFGKVFLLFNMIVKIAMDFFHGWRYGKIIGIT